MYVNLKLWHINMNLAVILLNGQGGLGIWKSDQGLDR